MTRDEVRDMTFGAFAMLILMSVGMQMSPQHQQYIELKKLKAECEKDLPRSETCVIVALPKSKD